MPPDEAERGLAAMIAPLSRGLLALDPGPLARLRRMVPEGPGVGEFWELAACHHLSGDDRSIRLVRLLAILTPKGDPRSPKRLHDPKRSLGAALAKTNYPEMRLLRFLALPFEARGPALERMVRWLSAKGHDGVDCAEIAGLLSHPDTWRARRLADGFYRVRHAEETGATEKEDSHT
jgi:CRISPR system Cascade subunit CasB